MEGLIYNTLIQYQFWAIFFGAFFFGETVILTAAFLAVQGWWSWESVFLISLLGTVVSDVFWFLAAGFVSKTKRWQKYEERYQRLVRRLDRKVGDRPYLALFIIKFLYGTRVLTIIYLSLRKISLWKFLFFDILSTLIWLAVIVPLGFWAGKGYQQGVELFHNIAYVISALFFFFVLYRMVNLWISKKITQE